jgi:hypothetical protein
MSSATDITENGRFGSKPVKGEMSFFDLTVENTLISIHIWHAYFLPSHTRLLAIATALW